MYIRQNILEENLLKNLSISILGGNRILGELHEKRETMILV